MGRPPVKLGVLDEEVPNELACFPTLDLKLGLPSPTHWSVEWDTAFVAHLESLSVICEAAKKGKGRGQARSGSGGKTTKPGPLKKPGQGVASKEGAAPKQGEKSIASRTRSSESSLVRLKEELGLPNKEGFEEDIAELSAGILDTPTPQEDLVEVEGLLQSVRSFQLQALHKMGSVRMVDRALAEGLMAEFSRLTLVVDDDLNVSLQGHHNNIQEASQQLEWNVKGLFTPLLGIQGGVCPVQDHLSELAHTSGPARQRKRGSDCLLVPMP